MNISIDERGQELIRRKVESGDYGSPEEVVKKALNLLDEYDQELAELRQKVQLGIDQIERGEYVEYTDENLHELFEEIEAEGLQELAAKRKNSE